MREKDVDRRLRRLEVDQRRLRILGIAGMAARLLWDIIKSLLP